MSNLRWFDNPEFQDICMENKLEALINGEGSLVLVCPKYPGKAIEEKLGGLIPKEQPWAIVEGASTGNLSTIKVMLMMFGARDILFKNLPDHRLVLEVENAPQATALEAGSPIWDQVAHVIRSDEFVQSYQIRVNGEVYRDSDGYVKPDDPGSPEMDMEEQPPLSEQAKANMQEFQRAQREPPKPIVTAKVEDDRFDYDRDFLPVDVGTDVKILLESTNSVEDFLKSI